jgi:hypothetical protein
MPATAGTLRGSLWPTALIPAKSEKAQKSAQMNRTANSLEVVARDVADELIRRRPRRVADIARRGHHEDSHPHSLCGDQIAEDVQRLEVAVAPRVTLPIRKYHQDGLGSNRVWRADLNLRSPD